MRGKSLAKLINDSQVQVVPANEPFMMVPSPASSLHTEILPLWSKHKNRYSRKRSRSPVWRLERQDSSFLRAKGVQAYGLYIPRTAEENRTPHGNDERVQLKQLGNFVHYLYTAVQQVVSD